MNNCNCKGSVFELPYVTFEDFESEDSLIPSVEEALPEIKSCKCIPSLFSNIKACLLLLNKKMDDLEPVVPTPSTNSPKVEYHQVSFFPGNVTQSTNLKFKNAYNAPPTVVTTMTTGGPNSSFSSVYNVTTTSADIYSYRAAGQGSTIHVIVAGD